MDQHSFDSHCVAVDEMCRVCGAKNDYSKFKKKFQRNPKRCEDIKSDLMLVFGINVDNDQTGIHAQHVCYKCSMMMRNVKARQSATSVKKAREIADNASKIWCAFTGQTIDECTACSHRAVLSLGNRYTPRPTTQTVNTIAPSTSSRSDTQKQQSLQPHIVTEESFEAQKDLLLDSVILPQTGDNSLQPLAASTPIRHVKPQTKDAMTSPISFRNTPPHQKHETSTSPAFK